MTTPEDLDVVVLLGADWASLRTAGLRWRFLAPRLTALGLARRVTVVDFPHFRRRAAVDPRFRLVREKPTWDPAVRVLDATVPAGTRPDRLDPLAWWRVGRAIGAALGPGAERRLAVATSPLWVPALTHLPARWHTVDAEDDLRHYDGVAHLTDRTLQGYRRIPASARTVTANSAVLTDTLIREFGVPAVHVGNGVDLHSFTHPGPPPPGLPDPFAVYVGTIQQRVDLDLLAATARLLGSDLPVVIAGPADPALAPAVATGPWHYLGPLPHEQVPGLLAAARVGLVPHRRDPFTASMEPLKVLEYLAADLPVVATRLPGLEPLGDSVVCVDTAEEMAEAARAAATAHPAPGMHRARVAGRDWDDVARRLLALYTAAEH